MISDRNVAGAVGGKTARPCENCVRRRARWFCPADDAFLCQACDASVHSANSLAGRHVRVRLKTASFASRIGNRPLPTWHRGFTRKPRTPRHAKPAAPPHSRSDKHGKPREDPTHPVQSANKAAPREPLVPELSADDVEAWPDDNDEHLLYRVPIFDPFEATGAVLNDAVKAAAAGSDPSKGSILSASCCQDRRHDDVAGGTDLHGASPFLPSEMDLADFAADVESLLGSGLEQECFGMDELGLQEECQLGKEYNYPIENSPLWMGADGSVEFVVKDEKNDGYAAAREPFKPGFEFHSRPAACGGVDEKSAVAVPVGGEQKMMAVSVRDGERGNNSISSSSSSSKGSKILLRLDYEAIITAWEGHGSPWTGGGRPELNPDDCWPDCMGTEVPCGPINYEEAAGGAGCRPGVAVGDQDGGREARVSRYREKRRTRLFSKKIRYEVRKLNAEKRPRMKGRFVKRASVLGHALPNYIRT